MGFKAGPVLTILVAIALFMTIAPRVWLEILVWAYRVLAPTIGRGMTTVLQTLATVAAGMLWLYLWRESFRRLFRRLSTERRAGAGTS